MFRTVETEVARASKAWWTSGTSLKLAEASRSYRRSIHKSTNSFLFMTPNRQFRYFIIITMILTTTHDSTFGRVLKLRLWKKTDAIKLDYESYGLSEPQVDTGPDVPAFVFLAPTFR